MLTSTARGFIYSILALVCLVCAAMVYGFGWAVGALLGGFAAVVLSLLLNLSARDSTVLNALTICGGLLGAGYALILLCRVWISQAKESGDERLRAIGDYFDELSHAMWPRPKR